MSGGCGILSVTAMTYSEQRLEAHRATAQPVHRLSSGPPDVHQQRRTDQGPEPAHDRIATFITHGSAIAEATASTCEVELLPSSRDFDALAQASRLQLDEHEEVLIPVNA